MNTLKQQLQQCRLDVDAIDAQLLALLNQRAELSLCIGQIKQSNDPELSNIRDRDREIDIIKHITDNNQGPFEDQQLVHIFECIIDESRQLQQRLKND